MIRRCVTEGNTPPSRPRPLAAKGLLIAMGSAAPRLGLGPPLPGLSRVRLLATPWTAVYQAPPSMGFSRQEYWSGVPLPSLVLTLRSRPCPTLAPRSPPLLLGALGGDLAQTSGLEIPQALHCAPEESRGGDHTTAHPHLPHWMGRECVSVCVCVCVCVFLRLPEESFPYFTPPPSPFALFQLC